MAQSLLAEFDCGRADYLEGKPAASCPYLATSDCADAYHAGRAYEARRPSVYGPSRVWHGRGYRINVEEGAGFPAGRKAPRVVYLVTYAATPAATRVEA